MDTTFLANLLQVADSGSMAEAARRIGVTPAAIAQQIQALERDLGVELLVRAGRTVVPTDAGHRVLAQARTIVQGIDNLRSVAQENEISGELRIGTITSALLTVLPDVFARYARKYPLVKVRVRAGTSAELFLALQQREIDVAICLHPAFALPKAYDWHLLREEPIVVLAPARLAKASPDDLLRREPFIRYDRSLGGGRQADDYLRRARITPHELFELDSLMAIALMVDRGLGVSLVPDIATPLTRALKLARLPLPVGTDPRRFGILWNRFSPRIRPINGLLECADRGSPH